MLVSSCVCQRSDAAPFGLREFGAVFPKSNPREFCVRDARTHVAQGHDMFPAPGRALSCKLAEKGTITPTGASESREKKTIWVRHDGSAESLGCFQRIESRYLGWLPSKTHKNEAHKTHEAADRRVIAKDSWPTGLSLLCRRSLILAHASRYPSPVSTFADPAGIWAASPGASPENDG